MMPRCSLQFGAVSRACACVRHSHAAGSGNMSADGHELGGGPAVAEGIRGLLCALGVSAGEVKLHQITPTCRAVE